jgi:hypothetical protein
MLAELNDDDFRRLAPVRIFRVKVGPDLFPNLGSTLQDRDRIRTPERPTDSTEGFRHRRDLSASDRQVLVFRGHRAIRSS